MKEKTMRIISLSLVAAALMSTAMSASALTATQLVEKETIIRSEDGGERVVREAASQVTPGERIVYRLVYTNDDAEPATDLVLNMPVPAELTLVEGSEIMDGAVVAYSTDGGETFADRASVKVADADGALRDAAAQDITNIRWTLTSEVAVGASGELSFAGILK